MNNAGYAQQSCRCTIHTGKKVHEASRPDSGLSECGRIFMHRDATST